MTKTDLVELIADKAEISKTAADNAVRTFLDGVSKALKKGDKVTITGFGTFSVSARKARTGRNPQTGQAIKIRASKVVRFKAGAVLKNTVSGTKK